MQPKDTCDVRSRDENGRGRGGCGGGVGGWVLGAGWRSYFIIRRRRVAVTRRTFSSDTQDGAERGTAFFFFFFSFFKVPASSSLVSGASKLVGHIRLRVAGCWLHRWLRLQQRAETVWFSPEKLCTGKIVSLPDCISVKQVIKGIPYWHGYKLSLLICLFQF